MFDLEQAIIGWRRQMLAAGIRTPEPLDELESHLREDVEQQMRSGLSAQQAFETAVQQMGHAKELKAEFARAGAARPALRAGFVTLSCFVSAAFIVLIGTWTLLESETSPARRIFGLPALWLIALYLGSLPFGYRLLPHRHGARAGGTLKALSIVVHAWVLLAFFSAAQIVHLEVGITLTMIMWALCLAYAATIFAYMSYGQGEDAELAANLATFTPGATQSLEFAHEEASRFYHDFIGTEHVLLGLLTLENGIVPNVLRRLGVDRETVRKEIEKLVGRGLIRDATNAIPYTPRARKALVLAASEAKALNHPEVGAEHIFLGLLLEGSGVAAIVLKNLGLNATSARMEILKQSGSAAE